MLKKIILIMVVIGNMALYADIYTNDIYASDNSLYNEGYRYGSDNLDIEKSRNEELIEKYQYKIRALQKRNRAIDEVIYSNTDYSYQKKKHLKRARKLYEESNTNYIYRIKLDGNKISTMKSRIHKGYFKIEIQEVYKRKRNDFYENYRKYEKKIKLKRDVNNKHITYKVKGEYLEIIMPRYSRKKYKY